jgi:hypothetical protein
VRAPRDAVAHSRARVEDAHLRTDGLAAPADQRITIEFDNQYTWSHGNHNIHIYESPDEFIGESVVHGRSITHTVPAMPAGSDLFRCDEHPTLMNGVFIVK